ncbi:MAG: hypothetical protein HN348_06355 [Proteobacteria bacterium]|jgi:hypothetical protein|nr:hypothetical protein [Pseudomonadota bacterium]
MEQLPLVEEIREARRLSEEAHQAQLHIARIDAGLQSIAIVAQQHASHPTIQPPCPAGELVAELADFWPQFKSLADAGPRPSHVYHLQLTKRRSQLELCRQVLAPLTHDAQQRAQVLAELQHRQRHELEDPKWAKAVAELGKMGQERDKLVKKLTPLQQRIALTSPAAEMLSAFIDRLDGELETKNGPDERGRQSWRAVSMAKSMLATLDSLLGQLQLEIALPKVPTIPAIPDPVVNEQLWQEVIRTRRELADLNQIVGQEARTLILQADECTQRFEEITEWLKEQMG